MKKRITLPLILLIVSFFGTLFSHAQQIDTLKRKDSIPLEKVDSLIKAQHSPRKAAIRSALIPGWGQAYNRKYWKIPIIYAALGITGTVFVNNIKTYKDLRFAYSAKYKASIAPFDSTDYRKIKPQYLPVNIEGLREGRDQFRQYIDYSVVFFVLFWGLNVVDAVVDAHLKAFDISPDLSLKIRPAYNPLTNTAGVSLVFNFRH
ncbi:MAG TPA: DUF5683 domain-containing protein [Chitinophagaceae bacterium]